MPGMDPTSVRRNELHLDNVTRPAVSLQRGWSSDAIVIDAALGGLSAAAVLAEVGKRALGRAARFIGPL